MLIQLKHRYSGEVIFEHVQENNSTKITVELAIKDKVDLRGSDLRGSDLSGSDLSGSDLSWSDLSESDLRGSDLSRSDLRGSNLRESDLRWSDLSGSDLRESDLSRSDLRGSNLRGADLRGSNLRGSNLLYVTGEMNFVFSMQLDTWLISFTKDILNIGCQSFPIEDWFQFSDEEISKMDVAALEWWKEWKEPLRLIIETRLGEKI